MNDMNNVSMRLLSFLQNLLDHIIKRKLDRVYIVLFQQAIDNVANLLTELGDTKNALDDKSDRYNELKELNGKVVQRLVNLYMAHRNMIDMTDFWFKLGQEHDLIAAGSLDNEHNADSFFRSIATDMFSNNIHEAVETVASLHRTKDGKAFPKVAVYRWLKSYFQVTV